MELEGAESSPKSGESPARATSESSSPRTEPGSSVRAMVSGPRLRRAVQTAAGSEQRAGVEGSAGPTSDRGAYGAEGASAPRDLGRAFARAIPAAVSGDPIWASLPLGPAGGMDVELIVDGDGAIRRFDVADHSAQPSTAAVTLVRRTVALLASGRFALVRGATSAGRETLRLRIVISQKSPPATAEREPLGVFGMGFEAPRGNEPGSAFFTLTSGRHVEVNIKVLRVTANP